LTCRNQAIFINTISGGIVNFGGALKIAPVSITSSSGGSGQTNKGLDIMENDGMLLPRLESKEQENNSKDEAKAKKK
jgi:hypothetical protein